jgi:hypothetical protein
MIPSNIELHRALDCGRLIVTPEPRPRAPDPNAVMKNRMREICKSGSV